MLGDVLNCFFAEDGLAKHDLLFLIRHNFRQGNVEVLGLLEELDLGSTFVVALDMTAIANSCVNIKRLSVCMKHLEKRGMVAFASAQLPKLRILEIPDSSLGHLGLQVLMNGQIFGQLTKLSLAGCGLTDESFALLSDGIMANLETLSIARNRITGAGTTRTFNPQSFPALKSLDASNNILSSLGFGTFITACSISSLKRLNVSRNQLDDQAFAGFPAQIFAQLTDLQLANNRIGHIGFSALLACDLPALQTLNVTSNLITHAACDNFKQASMRSLSNLSSVNFNYNPLTDLGVNLIAASRCPLVDLRLAGTKCNMSGISALSHSNFPLATLDLSDNMLDPKAIGALMQGNFSSLTCLHLASIGLTQESAAALSVGSIPTLKRLYLQRNVMNDAIIATLVPVSGAGIMASLTDLNLDSNLIGSDGLSALKNGQFSQLKTLDLSRNNISSAGVETLSANFPALTHLCLNSNPIGDVGVGHLAQCNALRLLELASCQITDIGVRTLANGNLIHLNDLILSMNPISNAAAIDIYKGNFPLLVTLSLTSTRICASGARLLTSMDLHKLALS